MISSESVVSGFNAERVGNYRLVKVIGHGTYAKVKLGINLVTNEKVAIKIIDKSSLRSHSQITRLSREIRILKLFNHPNIVKVYEVIESPTNLFIVMEYMRGGELFDYIVSQKRISEKESKKYFFQMISALQYCHNNNIVHRDLKPENLLLDGLGNLKIVDFGFCNFYKTHSLLSTFCGSPFYCSPDVLLGNSYVGPEVDIWSAGVTLFTLVCGYLPFDDSDSKRLCRKIIESPVHFPRFISQNAADLIGKMLAKNPLERITMTEILVHPFLDTFSIAVKSQPPRRDWSPEVIENIFTNIQLLGFTQQDISTLRMYLADVEDIKYTKVPFEPLYSCYYLIGEMIERENIFDAARRKKDSLSAVDEEFEVDSFAKKHKSEPRISNLNAVTGPKQLKRRLSLPLNTHRMTSTANSESSMHLVIDRPQSTHSNYLTYEKWFKKKFKNVSETFVPFNYIFSLLHSFNILFNYCCQNNFVLISCLNSEKIEILQFGIEIHDTNFNFLYVSGDFGFYTDTVGKFRTVISN